VRVIRIDVVPRALAQDAFGPFAIKACKQLCELVEGSPVRYGIENHGNTTNDPAFPGPFVRRRGIEAPRSHTGRGNFYWYGHPLGSLYGIYTRFAGRAFHTHCKNIRYPEDRREVRRPMGWEYDRYNLSARRGRHRLREVVRILRGAGYTGDLCLEKRMSRQVPGGGTRRGPEAGNRRPPQAGEGVETLAQIMTRALVIHAAGPGFPGVRQQPRAASTWSEGVDFAGWRSGRNPAGSRASLLPIQEVRGSSSQTSFKETLIDERRGAQRPLAWRSAMWTPMARRISTCAVCRGRIGCTGTWGTGVSRRWTFGRGRLAASSFSTGATLRGCGWEWQPRSPRQCIAAGTRLFLNDGTGRFTEVTNSGLSRTASATSLALADIDGDGDLDLYCTHYIDVMHLADPTTRFALAKRGGPMDGD